ncbi:hypothetical protein, partial [Paenibacillus darwinianus]|uniref:hypothetical protein n=2 Tax=Paenibacillus darwinianus TaxID=1380763 RepID=UPI001680D25A
MRNQSAFRLGMLLMLMMTLLATACSQGGTNGPTVEGETTTAVIDNADGGGLATAPAEQPAAYVSPLTG